MARPDKGVQYQLPKTQVDRLLQLPTKNKEATQAKQPAQAEKASSDSPSKTTPTD